MSSDLHTLYAWPMSLYSGKTRAYLRYKGIPYVEKEIRLWTFAKLKAKTGARVMPVVVTPDEQWLEDSSHIMDTLEARYPLAPVLPTTPRQRIAALLLEAWGDEFWLPSAMHYRWNFPENFSQVFQPEGGDHLLPYAPRFIKNALASKVAKLMYSYLDGLGVVPAQIPQIEAWTNAMCNALDTHFARYPYLLGTRPSYGDFGLIGPLFAHLGRDPYPARELIAPRPHLQSWIARMQQPQQAGAGAFLPDDEVPSTLAPLFASIFGEFWPQLQATIQQLQYALPTMKSGRHFKRSLGAIESPLQGKPYRRNSLPYSVWMAQRVLDAYCALTRPEQTTVQTWLNGIGGGNAMQLEIRPRLKRSALHVAPT